jgi:PD-(D/E)XK nuclease superfamily
LGRRPATPRSSEELPQENQCRHQCSSRGLAPSTNASRRVRILPTPLPRADLAPNTHASRRVRSFFEHLAEHPRRLYQRPTRGARSASVDATKEIIMNPQAQNQNAASPKNYASTLDVPSDILTHEIIGAGIEVHRHLGPGLLKAPYERALCLELAAGNSVSLSGSDPTHIQRRQRRGLLRGSDRRGSRPHRDQIRRRSRQRTPRADPLVPRDDEAQDRTAPELQRSRSRARWSQTRRALTRTTETLQPAPVGERIPTREFGFVPIAASPPLR